MRSSGVRYVQLAAWLPTKLWSTVWPDEDLTPGGGDPGWLGDVFALWFALPILAVALLPIALLVRSTDWAYRRLTGRPGMAEGGRVVEALGVTKDEKLSGEARALVDAGFRVIPISRVRPGFEVVFARYREPKDKHRIVVRRVVSVAPVPAEAKYPHSFEVHHRDGFQEIERTLRIVARNPSDGDMTPVREVTEATHGSPQGGTSQRDPQPRPHNAPPARQNMTDPQ